MHAAAHGYCVSFVGIFGDRVRVGSFMHEFLVAFDAPTTTGDATPTEEAEVIAPRPFEAAAGWLGLGVCNKTWPELRGTGELMRMNGMEVFLLPNYFYSFVTRRAERSPSTGACFSRFRG